MTRTNKHEIAEYGFSWELENIIKNDGAYPVSTDWQRLGITAEHHPHGAGKRFVQGRAYSNGIFRQLVELDDETWDDCVMLRNQEGIIILEHRLVIPTKAAHVANHYGVELMDKTGKPIPFIPDQPPMEVQQKSIAPPQFDRQKHAKYELVEFMAELERVSEVHEIMVDLVDFFNQRYGNWQVGENASIGAAYPYFNYHRLQYWPVVFRSDLRVELSFQWISKREPFTTNPALFDEFVEKLHSIFGYVVTFQTKGRPSFPIHVLTIGTNLKAFKEAMLWFRDTVIAETLPDVQL